MATRAQVDKALTEFGGSAGIAGLALDETDSCSLLINDDIQIDLQLDEAGGRLVLESVLGALPEARASATLLRLLHGNRLGIATNGGTLALGPANEIVLLRELRPAALDGPTLVRAIEQQAESARDWRQVLEDAPAETIDRSSMLDPSRFA
jgi:hypothetical protein